MSRRRKLSPQALSVLQSLLSRPQDWRYGYDLSKEVRLQSGTLYPLLMRLADDGMLESEWHVPVKEGLPARHAYRLTRAGAAYAREAVDAANAPTGGRRLSPA